VLKAILEDVRKLPEQDKPHARYFSLNHLLAGGATEELLNQHREALAKAVNHLSWQTELVRPRPVEPTNTVYCVDLRKLGWAEKPFDVIRDGRTVGPSDLNLYDLALLEYPYSIVYESSETFDKLAREFLAPACQVRPVPFVRADWFVSVATQPPLYEDLLQLPFRLQELEDRLGVNTQANLETFTARRAGLTESGVSHNNRVVERHPAASGAYWKSFDFRSSRGRDNIFRDPINLNPAGGEMIFTLPNKLQAYFITDARGNRLEVAPTEVVTDVNAADQAVRNGLACMRCHERGMKEWDREAVRAATEQLPGSPGFDRRQVLRLYGQQKEMDELLKKDTRTFLEALKELHGKAQTSDPLRPVSQRFLDAPLQLTAAARELGLAGPEGLESMFRAQRFTSLGLAPLTAQGSVRRDTWEDFYDQVVRQMGLGVPVVPLDSLTRPEYQQEPAPFAVDLKAVDARTNRPKKLIEPNDEIVIVAANRSREDVHFELVGTSAQGKKVVLPLSSRVIKPGQEYRTAPIKCKPGLGKEQVTVFASNRPLPAGQHVRIRASLRRQGKDIADRYVHPFYALRSTARGVEITDPAATVVKKTIEIETR
jgi:serine/threonine-protein kinase